MSGLPCSTCADARRPEIDALLVSGASLRDIAGRFGTSKSALSRHRPHVGTALVRAAERKGERLDETILRKVERLEADARRLGEKAEAEGDLRCALAAVRELLDVVKLLREMTPTPAPTEADVRRLAERLAAEAGVSADELLVLAEKLAERAAGLGYDAGAPAVVRAIVAAAELARRNAPEPPFAPALPSPVSAVAPAAPASPPPPFRMSVTV